MSALTQLRPQPILHEVSTMMAASIAEPRRIELIQTSLPEVGPGELRVRLEGCGVCASSIPSWEGRPWFEYPMAPGAPGHEGWGRVDAIGANVSGFELGDRVAFLSSHAYAQWDVTPASSAIKLPVDFDDLPFPGEPLGCAMNIFARSGINPGDTVAIVGFGFLGALLTQLASTAGARVVVVSRRAESIEMAHVFGARVVYLLEEGDSKAATQKVSRITRGRLCRVVVEATGKQAGLELASELAGERGRLVIAGYHQDGLRQVNMQLWNWRGLDVINAHEREPSVYLEGMRTAIAAVLEGRISPGRLLTHRFPLERLGEALEMAARRPAGFMKAVVLMERDGQSAPQPGTSAAPDQEGAEKAAPGGGVG